MIISIDEEVYKALHRVIGHSNISRFIEDLARPHVLKSNLASTCQAMVVDAELEQLALEWAERVSGVE